MRDPKWTQFWSGTPGALDWCHTGIAVLDSGGLAFGAAESGVLMIIDGAEMGWRRIVTPLVELHGITAVGDELWVADPGVKPDPSRNYEWIESPGRAVRLGLDGAVMDELTDPFTEGLSSSPWRPTAIAVVRTGPLAGSIWVADGYGANLLHVFTPDGKLRRTVDGSATGAPFSCPHGIVIADTDGDQILIVADRRNRRLVRLTPEGELIDVIEGEPLRSPSCLASRDGRVVLTELDGAVLEIRADGTVATVVDRGNRSENDEGWPDRAGWPNIDIGGGLRRPALIAGVLNSPHGVAIGLSGEIYLTEWVIGGNFIVIPALSSPGNK